MVESCVLLLWVLQTFLWLVFLFSFSINKCVTYLIFHLGILAWKTNKYISKPSKISTISFKTESCLQMQCLFQWPPSKLELAKLLPQINQQLEVDNLFSCLPSLPLVRYLFIASVLGLCETIKLLVSKIFWQLIIHSSLALAGHTRAT